MAQRCPNPDCDSPCIESSLDFDFICLDCGTEWDVDDEMMPT
jgi:hypothetical protein